MRDHACTNGNISSMVVNIGKFNYPLMYYTYDHLNRIKQLDVDGVYNQTTNTWITIPTSIYGDKEMAAYGHFSDFNKTYKTV